MKRSLLFSLFLISYIVNASTNVKGGIYSNTTWTKANSPYIVTDTIVVFPGVTLTIQPGVTVEFANNVELEIRQATLIALGTSSDSIIFTSNATFPTPGIYSGIYLDPGDTTKFSYCHFCYANTAITDPINSTYASFTHCNFNLNIYGIQYLSAVGIVDSCNFRNNTSAIYWSATILIENCNAIKNTNGITNSESTITDCIIDSNANIGFSCWVNGVCKLKNCEIKYNGIGVIGGSHDSICSNLIEDNNIGIKLGTNDIYLCNSICNNTKYNLFDSIAINQSLNHNYWCLTDSAKIQATIYDGYQNIHYGLVFFTPFDTLPCKSVGDTTIITSLSAINENINFISIYPNPVTNELFINLHQAIDGILTLTNVFGQDVYSTKISGSDGSTQKINTSNLQQGVYFLKMESNGQILTKKVLKI
jgi:hypothetical protein